MPWPLSQDYNEAIQSPASNFADPDLRRGDAACNALGIPMPYSGNFADVYQVRCPDGTRWAIKCFTREVLGLRERYQEISRHLGYMKLPFTVDFTYLERGIRVMGKWYPALKMQWVEGLTLNQFVGKYADSPAVLETLLRRWGGMAKYLRQAQVGHCDLQHGNILLVPGASDNSLALKLIDYDGMWVPALAGKKSGELGHPAYQHPQRLRAQTYNIDVDRFPVLLIATALRALKVKGRPLWDKYYNGDNVLFKEADLLAPLKSHLFLDLTKTGDALVSRMMDILVKALRGSLETVPLLEDVMPEEPQKPVPNPVRSPTSAKPARASVLAATPAPTPPTMTTGKHPWNFEESAPGPSEPDVPWSTPAKIKGVPIWMWAVAISLLVVALSTVGGVGFWSLSDRGRPPEQDRQAAGVKEPVPAPTQGPKAAPRDESEERPDEKPQDPPSAKIPPPSESASPPGGEVAKSPSPDSKPPVSSDQTPPTGKRVTNSIGMVLVRIEPGKFLMGSPMEERNRSGEEGPQHEVEITRPFYMGVYPVTKGQFAAFVESESYKTEAETNKRGGYGYSNASRSNEGPYPKYDWRNTGWEQTDMHPVVNMSWNDAVKFCQWLSTKENRVYELPTEAEWEYACRAGTKTAYFFGDDPKDLGDYAWFRDNAGNQTHPVGGKKPNPWGLYDMSGNVWQWCGGRFVDYQLGYTKDPKSPDNGDGILRGGSWYNESSSCRSATRYRELHRTLYDFHGFRVVLRAVQTGKTSNPVVPDKNPDRADAKPTPDAPVSKPDPGVGLKDPDADWIKHVAALPAREQIKAVADELKKRNPRAYASPLLQDTVGAKDFFKEFRGEGSGEPFLGDAQLGRVRLQQRQRQPTQQRQVLGGVPLGHAVAVLGERHVQLPM